MRTGTFALVSLVLIAGLSAPARAGFTIYTDRAAFLGALEAGSYTETFDSLTPGDTGLNTLNFSGSGYSYTASTSGIDTLFPFVYDGGDPADIFLSNRLLDSQVTFTFTGGNVTAVGGYFSNASIGDLLLVGEQFSIAIPGMSLPYVGTTATAYNFVGFISSDPITSLVMSPLPNGEYAAVSDLTVGTALAPAVPEPSSLVSLGIAGLVVLAMRCRRGLRPAA